MTEKVLKIETDPSQVGKPLVYDEQLYLEVREFLEDHIDLVDESEFDVLTAKIFESWLIFKFHEIGYIFFVGPPRSGKTRCLETMAALCYNPKFAAYMSQSAVYRILDAEWCTLFLDEIQQYLKEDRATFMAILNAGQRRGQEVIISVPKGGDWIPTGFKVFGSKLLASTEDTAKALSTRCIIISMVKNVRSVPLRINYLWAEKLRGKLNQYASKVGAQKVSDTESLFRERGFKDYRNIEIFINLVALTPPLYRRRILDYAKKIDDQIAEEDGLSFYAELFKAVEYAYQGASDSKISVAAVAEAYNDGKSEQERLSNQSTGGHLKVMGLRRVCRMPKGRMGRYVSEKLMKRLKRRYGSPQQTKIVGDKGERSEPSEGKGDLTLIPTPSPIGKGQYPPTASLHSQGSHNPSLQISLTRVYESLQEAERVAGGAIPVEDFYKVKKAEGCSGPFLDKMLKALKTDGMVYEPRPGFLKTTEGSP